MPRSSPGSQQYPVKIDLCLSEGRLQYLADQLTLHVVEDGRDDVQSCRVTPALIDLQNRQESAVKMQGSAVTL